MALDNRDDPPAAFNFAVSLMDSASSTGAAITTIAINTLTDNIDAGFNECSGLEMILDVHEYEEGGNNGTVLKFPTRMKWGKLVMKKGIIKNTDLWDWVYGFCEGEVVRKDGLITLLGEKGLAHTVWKFKRGLPVKYTGPQLNAQQNAIAFESIEIEHEGLELMTGASGLASAISSAAEGIGSLFD
ncbi:phage tail protein [Mangrovimicrobium sediminis]|uniref:Phage tail protein n=1 Tax=Mangrovimicrobium sediminis TaxID=2562682 RepID=A0A4Z0M8Y6_9GAMM|nr:phage tail protein [Haliea sp. SAOS-164]TGD76182.1 phage tail protein [Haliea sp. SAOS-164]